jgi:hypothetical protein
MFCADAVLGNATFVDSEVPSESHAAQGLDGSSRPDSREACGIDPGPRIPLAKRADEARVPIERDGGTCDAR